MYDSFKEKVFEERPEVKEEYDVLKPEYDKIRESVSKVDLSGPGATPLPSDFGESVEDLLKEEPFERISEHGYRITPKSDNHAFGQLMLKHKPVKCIICGPKMSKVIRPHYLGRNIVTINKSVPDGVFYINRIDRREV